MHSLILMASLAATALAEAYTELSPAQSSEIYSKIQTLSATRPVVISVQNAVRSQLPADTFPDPSVGPFFQEDFASLAQAESPVFTEAPWFPSISTDLQAAYRTLEDPALYVERSIINEVVPITNGPAVPEATTFATQTRSS
ncbi:hypothetical protein D0859_08052 [Hortaea werneckii]|uniref:Uncharacterized protein n=1 Tax=Hortaea werneckii TaxID=91943 RepID=A0A3M7IQQ6_HORWE|nr:hypothetical protein D0863_00684 [Hortaea werneckii]RMZ27881.1 hypothetical protein D0859_08052 [Hortaea werneckii]